MLDTLWESEIHVYTHTRTHPSTIRTTHNLRCFFICANIFVFLSLRCCGGQMKRCIDVSRSGCTMRPAASEEFAKSPSPLLNFWLRKGCKQRACMHAYVWKSEVCVCVSTKWVICVCPTGCEGRGGRSEGFQEWSRLFGTRSHIQSCGSLQLKVVGQNLGARRLFVPIHRGRCLVPESHPAGPCMTQSGHLELLT